MGASRLRHLAVGSAACKALTGAPLEFDASPRLSALRRLKLGAATVAEARAEAHKALPPAGRLWRCSQAEERVKLNGALPQMLGGLAIAHAENECVLLLLAHFVVFDDDQDDFLAVKVETSDFWPEKNGGKTRDLGIVR